MKSIRTLEYCTLYSDNDGLYHIKDNNGETLEILDYFDEALDALYFHNKIQLLDQVKKYYN